MVSHVQIDTPYNLFELEFVIDASQTGAHRLKKMNPIRAYYQPVNSD